MAVVNLPSLRDIVKSINVAVCERGVNSQVSPIPLISSWKLFHSLVFFSVSWSISQMLKPSSMKRLRNWRCGGGLEMINSCSKMATKRFAIVGAGDMPMAIPLCCLMKRSLKRIRLLCMMMVSASMSALGTMCGNSVRVVSECRNVDIRARRWDVSIFVYMDIAS